jgi:hypothetical protein
MSRNPTTNRPKKPRDKRHQGVQPDLMERTRATVCLLQSRRGEDEKMYAFLSLFHPNMPEVTKRQLARDAK